MALLYIKPFGNLAALCAVVALLPCAVFAKSHEEQAGDIGQFIPVIHGYKTVQPVAPLPAASMAIYAEKPPNREGFGSG